MKLELTEVERQRVKEFVESLGTEVNWGDVKYIITQTPIGDLLEVDVNGNTKDITDYDTW